MNDIGNLEESLSQKAEVFSPETAIDDGGVGIVQTEAEKDQPPQDVFETEVPKDGPQPKPCTDLGNAQRFVEMFGRELRYCPQTKNFFILHQGQWVKDSGEMVFNLAYQVPPRIEDEAKAEHLTSDQVIELQKHAKKSASKGRIMAMIDLAKWFTRICVRVEVMDSNPWLLNCQNGSLDLRTGQLRAHDPSDLITKMLPVNYEPDCTCPVWQATIERIMGGDQEKIGFLKRVLGYAMTGVTSEQCMFVLYGSGANGKSTILEIFRELLAGYAMHTTTASLLGSNGPIRNDLARLNGPRFVSAVEIGMGKKLDEALVKQLTGGDQVTARFLYNEYFEYKPQFKLFIAANHKPEIQGVDHGIWRRIHLIPFDVTLSPEEIDRDLPNKLRAELPGILAWAVQGCQEWQEQGLNVPETISNATASYREEMDIVAGFLDDCCQLTVDDKTALAALYEAYKKWAENACQDVLGKKTFGNLMRQKGFRQSKSGGVRSWNGIGLIEQ